MKQLFIFHCRIMRTNFDGFLDTNTFKQKLRKMSGDPRPRLTPIATITLSSITAMGHITQFCHDLGCEFQKDEVNFSHLISTLKLM